MGFLRKAIDFVARPSHSRTMGILIFFVLIAAVSLTVIVGQQQQETRQRAAETTYSCLTYWYNDDTCTTLDHTTEFSATVDASHECNSASKTLIACHLLSNGAIPTTIPSPTSSPAPTQPPPNSSNCATFTSCSTCIATDHPKCAWVNDSKLNPPINSYCATAQNFPITADYMCRQARFTNVNINGDCNTNICTQLPPATTPIPTTPVSQLIQCNIDNEEGQFRCRSNCSLGEIQIQVPTTCVNESANKTCCLDRSKRPPTPTLIPSAQCINGGPNDDCIRKGLTCRSGLSCTQNPDPNVTIKDCGCYLPPAAANPSPTNPAAAAAPNDVVIQLAVKMNGLPVAGTNLHRRIRSITTVVQGADKTIAKTGNVEFSSLDGLFKTDPNIHINLGSEVTNSPGNLVIKSDFFKGRLTNITLHPGVNVLPTTTLQVGIGDDGISEDAVSYYNALISCYGNKACSDKNAADLNDDGKVDGKDFNFFVRSLAIIEGLLNPEALTKPISTPTPNITPTPKPTP